VLPGLINDYNGIHESMANQGYKPSQDYVNNVNKTRGIEPVNVENTNSPEQQPVVNPGGSNSFSVKGSAAVSGGGTSSQSGQKSNPIDMSMDANGNPIYGSSIKEMSKEDLQKSLEEDQNKLNELSQPRMQGQDENGNYNQDIAGSLMDIGRVGLGLKGALTKIPEYQPSAMISQYMQDAEQRKNMGLSPEEIGFAKNLAERGYGYDVKNIRALSGGSSGVALGNLGRATGQLQDQYSNIAAQDQAVRRQNRQQFYNAAGQAENINQYKFGLDYQNAMMNKQAGAALVQDAMGNMINRNQYNESHGPGSQYYQYMNELNQGQKDANQTLQDAQQTRLNESLASLKTGIDAKQKQLNSLTGDAQNINQISETNTNIPVNTTGLGSTLSGTGLGTGLSSLSPDELVKQDITKEVINTNGKPPVKEGEIYSKQTDMKTAPKYNDVKNTPEYKAEMQSVHDKIAEEKAKLVGANSFTTKVQNEKIKALQKKLDDIEKKHSDIADKMFDEDGNYIGK